MQGYTEACRGWGVLSGDTGDSSRLWDVLFGETLWCGVDQKKGVGLVQQLCPTYQIPPSSAHMERIQLVGTSQQSGRDEDLNSAG